MKHATLAVATVAAVGLAFSVTPSSAGGHKHKSHHYAAKHEAYTAHKAAKAERWAAKMEAIRAHWADKKARWQEHKARKMEWKMHKKHHHKKAPVPLG